jgi:hypothetical protein
MGPDKMFKALGWAMGCVFILLVLMLVSAFIVNYMIAPLLVSASHQLREVDWEQLRNLGRMIFMVTLIGICVAWAWPRKKNTQRQP